LLVQAFLLVLTLQESPFALGPEQATEGAGLNPLLQNPWMVIHPPVLFLGYAALTIPFAYAIAALWRRDYEGWIAWAWPWTLFAWGALGVGIALGGYWAYETLGWGGYWGWDPVENSSLVPWLTGAALVHGLITQRNRGTLVRWNLFLAPLTFLAVLYASFLTRSGVLGDASVHAFAESSLGPFLAGGVLLCAVLSGWLYLRRFREMPGRDIYQSILSLDFAFLAMVLILLASATVVLVGTSTPVFSQLFGPGTTVAASFYTITNAPIGLVLILVMILPPALLWGRFDRDRTLRALCWPALAAVVVTAIALAIGARNPLSLVYIFLAAFAVGSNVVMVARMLQTNVLRIGGYLAHVGVGLMVVGIIGSSVYSPQQELRLTEGGSGEAFGYQFTFQGFQPTAVDRGNLIFNVVKGRESFLAEPRLQAAEQGLVRTPYIRKYWLEDLYIAPGEYIPGEAGPGSFDLGKGEVYAVAGYTIRFVRFDLAQHTETGPTSVGSVLEVTPTQGAMVVLTPTLALAPGQQQEFPAQIPNTPASIALQAIDATNGRVALVITGLEGVPAPIPAEVTIEVSRKPAINLLWLGIVVLAAGTIIALLRRRREAQRLVQAEAEAAAQAAEEHKAAARRTPAGRQRRAKRPQ
jgi:cytochrome c-type biogenesis protein CcmF